MLKRMMFAAMAVLCVAALLLPREATDWLLDHSPSWIRNGPLLSIQFVIVSGMVVGAAVFSLLAIRGLKDQSNG